MTTKTHTFGGMLQAVWRSVTALLNATAEFAEAGEEIGKTVHVQASTWREQREHELKVQQQEWKQQLTKS